MHRREFLTALTALIAAPVAFCQAPRPVIPHRKMIARVRITEEALRDYEKNVAYLRGRQWAMFTHDWTHDVR